MKKPKNIEEFKKWLHDNHNIKTDNSDGNYYTQVLDKAKTNFEKGEFWTRLFCP